jgi:cystathionine beta-lyase/cystathionine gamma-synthase
MTTKAPETVPCFDTIEALQQGLDAKANFEAVNLYPRDGTAKLSQAESQAAHLARVEHNELLLFNSGMSAVKVAVEVALDEARSDEAPVLAHSRQLYSQTGNFLNSYIARRGVKLVSFDAGCPESTSHIIEKHRPNVILTETVGNAPDVPLLDVDGFRHTVSESAADPVVILDNTLPLSTALPLGEMLDEEENVLVVESGTKAYTFNTELSGLIYSKNNQLLQAVRQYRRTTGTMPGLGSLDRIHALLPETREAFDTRNHRLFAKTGALALSLYEAEQQGADFIVSHPSLQSHANSEYSDGQYQLGSSPVLFLQCTGGADQFTLAQRLWEDQAVRQHAELGQSFGFDRTRILPDEFAPTVRISGGAFTNTDELGPALSRAALNNS